MHRIVLTIVLVATGAAAGAALVMWRQPAEGLAAATAIVPPARTAADPPPVSPPPAVPAQAAAIPSLTFVLETTRSGPEGTRRTAQMITRTRGRVRLVVDEGGKEWLFVQNAIYPDRAAAYLTDHTRREIQFHEESSLRSLLQVKGWKDVLTLRFDPTALATLRDTGERRQVSGFDFERHVATRVDHDGVTDVWWSEALLLPLSLTTRAAGTEMTSVVTGLSHNVDAELLADPPLRFPTYRVLDPADVNDGH